MGLFSSIINAGSQAAANKLNAQIARENMALQDKWNTINYNNLVEEQQYQRGLQKEIFAREDNAQQRAVKDLVAAGLNPALAAGNGAGAGSTTASVVPMGTAPQNNYRQNPVTVDIDLLGTAQGIQQLRAMNQNIKYAETHDLPVGSTPPNTLESWLISVLDPYGKDIANKVAQKLGIKIDNPSVGFAGAGEKAGDVSYNPPIEKGDLTTSSGAPARSRVPTLNKQIENLLISGLTGKGLGTDPNYWEGDSDSARNLNLRRGYDGKSPRSYHTINGKVYESIYSPKTKGYHFRRYY